MAWLKDHPEELARAQIRVRGLPRSRARRRRPHAAPRSAAAARRGSSRNFSAGTGAVGAPSTVNANARPPRWVAGQGDEASARLVPLSPNLTVITLESRTRRNTMTRINTYHAGACGHARPRRACRRAGQRHAEENQGQRTASPSAIATPRSRSPTTTTSSSRSATRWICALRIVDAIKTELKMPKLDVKYQLVTSANRIPLMANGTIDLECGSTTNNVARQKEVSFTITHFLTANRIVSKKAANLKSIADLKGKTIVSTVGHDEHQAAHRSQHGEEHGHEHHPGERPSRSVPDGRDRPRGRLRDGRHPALQPRRAVAQPRRDYVISDFALSLPEPYGIMMRRDDPAVQESRRQRDDPDSTRAARSTRSTRNGS